MKRSATAINEGQRIFVTGANAGIGLALSKVARFHLHMPPALYAPSPVTLLTVVSCNRQRLYAASHHVYLGSRSIANGEKAVAEVKALYPGEMEPEPVETFLQHRTT